METPISSGDLCEVVGGLGRGKSPNMGKRVSAVSLQGDHSTLGRVWRCTGDGVVQLGDGGEYLALGWADFPVAWLKKIEPPPMPAKSEKKAVTA